MIKLNINNVDSTLPFSVWHWLLWSDESGIHSNSSYWLQVSWHQNHPSSIKFHGTYIRKNISQDYQEKKTIQLWTEKQVEKHFFYKHKDKEDYFVVQNLLNHKNPSIYMGHCVMHRAVREDEISVKKNESVTILSSNLSRGYLVHRPPTSQVVLTIRNRLQHLAFRVLLQKAGSPPIVFISQGRQQENHPRGPSGLHRWFSVLHVSSGLW